MPTPTDAALYAAVKKEASQRFLAPTSIYKSAWIVRTYKNRGGKYESRASNTKGLKRWFKEDWVDLNRPIPGKPGSYEPCGRRVANANGVYPLCRPLKSVTKETPRTVSQLTEKSIQNAKAEKQKIKNKGRIAFLKNLGNKK
jgi:hypothetical protein